MAIFSFECNTEELVAWLLDHNCPYEFTSKEGQTEELISRLDKQEHQLAELLDEVDKLSVSLEATEGRADKAEKEVVDLLSPSSKRPPPRFLLPDERRSVVHEFRVGNTALGHGTITVGMYPDTEDVGEIFIKMAVGSRDIFDVESKDPAVVRMKQQVSDLAWFLRGILDQLAIAVSVGLQRGIPLEVYVEKFQHTRFPPDGMTRNPDVPRCTSIVDYLFRWLSFRFLGVEEK